MAQMELPDRWYHYGEDEWRFRSGTISARVNMKVDGSLYEPILADRITYEVRLWTSDADGNVKNLFHETSYKSLEKAKAECEEQIRNLLEHIDDTA